MMIRSALLSMNSLLNMVLSPCTQAVSQPRGGTGYTDKSLLSSNL